MPPRPPLSARRPQRPDAPPPEPPVQIAPAPVPAVDLEGAEAVAFTLLGRTAGDAVPTPTPAASEPPAEPWAAWTRARPPALPTPVPNDTPLVSIKLPTESGRRLAAIAERRGSKRTMVALEALAEPLRWLAAEHRAGRFPELPRVVAGSARASIAFAPPPDLAADLDFVLRARRAVRAQIVTRLLVPAIDRLFAREVGGGAE